MKTACWASWLVLLVVASARAQEPPAQPGTTKSARLGPVRLALIAAYELETGRNLADFALVRLTPDKEIQLLERTAVERIVQEQKLSLSGLVDARSAVQAGKILGVDLLGVVDASIEGKQNLGLVIFDAASGARLVDIIFGRPDLQEQAGAVAEGVRAAARKWRAGTSNLKTVCFLPVRNADLPRGMDEFCEAMSASLERKLLEHPAIVTLERKRLDAVTKEKELASQAAHRELAASVLLVEMELARVVGGDGVRGTVLIRDSAGKLLHTIRHQVSDSTGAALLGPILQGVHAALLKVEGTASVDVAREAKQFLGQAKTLSFHMRFRQALQAAEAAYALKADQESRDMLTGNLISYASETLKPGFAETRFAGFTSFEAEPQRVRQALNLATRAYELKSISPRKLLFDASNWRQFHPGFMFQLGAVRVQPADPAVEQALREFRISSLRRQVTWYRELAEGDRATPERIEHLAFELMITHDNEVRHCAPDSTALMQALCDLLAIWLDASKKLAAESFPAESTEKFTRLLLGSTVHARTTLLLGEYSSADRELSLPVLAAFKKHPSPIIRLYATHYETQQLLKLERITRGAAEKRRRQIVDEAKRWIDPPPKTSSDAQQIAFYYFLKEVHMLPQGRGAKQESDDCLALAEFMLKRRDVVAAVWIEMLKSTRYFPENHARAHQMIRRMLEVCESRPHRLDHEPLKDLRSQLKQFEKTLLGLSPDLAKGTKGDTGDKERSVPWDKVTVIAELKAFPDAIQLMMPVRHDSYVYLFTGGVDPVANQPVVQLVRGALDGRPPVSLGRAFITLKDFNPKQPNFGGEGLLQAVIHNDHIYAATPSDGIYAFPLAGGAGRRIGDKEGLPALRVTSLAALENKLFAILTDGYMVVYDLEAKRADVIVSTRRVEKLSPFDNGIPFHARELVADPARSRVLFSLLQAPQKPAMEYNQGMFEYNLKTRQFKMLLPTPGYQASPVYKDAIFLHAQDWIARFDLATNQFTLLQGQYPYIDPPPAPAGLPADFSAAFPQKLYHGGYLWKTGLFGRQPIKGGNEELFASVLDPRNFPTVYPTLEAVSANELLLGNHTGVVLVRLKN